MKVTLLAFGIAKDITGQRFLDWELPENATVGSLRAALVERFPRLADLASVKLAVNSEYATDEYLLNDSDEVAMIPPVSGG